MAHYWELAGSDEATRFALLERALTVPEAARRFNRRHELCVQAAVGLDLALRDRLLDDLIAPLVRKSTTVPESEESLAIALLAAELGATEQTQLTFAGQTLAVALEKAGSRRIHSIAKAMGMIVPRLESGDAREALEHLIGAAIRPDNAESALLLGKLLRSTAARIVIAGDVTSSVVSLVKAIDAADLVPCFYIVGSLVTMLDRMESSTDRTTVAKSSIERIIQRIGYKSNTRTNSYDISWSETAGGLVALLDDTARRDALNEIDRMLDHIDAENLYDLISMAYDNKIVLPNEHKGLVERAIDRMESLIPEVGGYDFLLLLDTLVKISPRLESEAAKRCARAISMKTSLIFEATGKPRVGRDADTALELFYGRLTLEALDSLANAYLDELEKAEPARKVELLRLLQYAYQYSWFYREDGPGKQTAAVGLARGAMIILQSLGGADLSDQMILAHYLGIWIPRLHPRDAERAFSMVISSMAKLSKPTKSTADGPSKEMDRKNLGRYLVSAGAQVAKSLDESGALAALSSIRPLIKGADADSLLNLAELLIEVRKMLADPNKAVEATVEIDEALVEYLQKAEKFDQGIFRAILNSYDSWTGELAPAAIKISKRKAVGAVGQIIVSRFDRPRTQQADKLASNLTELASLDVEAAGPLVRTVVASTLAAIDEARGDDFVQLASTLAELSKWIEPASATRVARLLSAQMEGVGPDSLSSLVASLLKVSEKIPSTEATTLLSEAARRLVEAMESSNTPAALRQLADPLRDLVDKLDRVHLVDLAPRIVASLEKLTDPHDLNLRICIKQLSKRIDRSAGVRLVGQYLDIMERRGESLLGFQLRGMDVFPASFGKQQVLDLLSWPTCVGSSREFLLEILQPSMGRQINGDRWEAARWAKRAGLRVRPPTSPLLGIPRGQQPAPP